MGVSSHSWLKIFGGTVCPPPLVRKTILAAEDERLRRRPAGLGCHAPRAH
jgi:hypothetical protein